MTTLADLEARVAALEASQYDYRAVLAAVNALGSNQREMGETQREMGETQREMRETLHDHGERLGRVEDRLRSLEDNTGEIKELLIRALDR